MLEISLITEIYKRIGKYEIQIDNLKNEQKMLDSQNIFSGIT
jgi:hypothetical protein